MAGNIFAEGMDAFSNAYNTQQKIGQDRAQIQAGRRLSASDYTGGAAILNNAGMIDQAHNVQADQQQLQDRQAAAGTLAAKQHAETLIKIAQGLKTVPPGQRHAALQEAAPIFQQIGMDPSHLTSLTEDQLSDQQLDMFSTSLGKAADEYTLKQGEQRFRDGKVVASGMEPDQKYVPVPEGGKLVPVPRGNQPVPTSAPVAPQPEADPTAGVSALTSMGAKVTSAQRSPEHNAAVGGVPNSRHLTGQAVDLVPPPNMTMAQLEAEARQRMPGARVLNEGTHVHVQWDGAQPAPRTAAGDPAGTIYGNPKPAKAMARPATAEEKAQYGIPADVPAQMKADGSIDVVNGTGAAQRPVPPTVKTALSSNSASVQKIDRAIAELERNPNAMGGLNIFGDSIRQRADPNGVGTRAQVANISSLIIHDRSGAAVTAAETPRLKPFIPMPTDTAKASIEKLRQLRNQYMVENAAIESGYGPDTGYRALTPSAPAPSKTPPAPAATPAPSGWSVRRVR